MTELVHTPDPAQSAGPTGNLFEELPSLLARGLVYVLLALLLAAALFAAMGRLDEMVAAPVVVAPRGEARPLQAAAGGRVTRVVVQEGDRVSAGQVLVYLETEPAEAERERARQEHAIRQRQLQDALAGRADPLQVAEARARLAQVEAAVVAAERTLDAAMIVAPVDGQVIRLAARGPGQALQPGELVAEVAPAGAPLVLVARVANRDVGRVRVGQRARVKIDAYPHQRFGALAARVTYVAPDAAAAGDAATFYRVTVTPEPLPGETLPHPAPRRAVGERRDRDGPAARRRVPAARAARRIIGMETAIEVNGEAVSLHDLLTLAKFADDLGFLRAAVDAALIRRAAAARGIAVTAADVQAEADSFRRERRLHEVTATARWLRAHHLTQGEWEAGLEQAVLARRLRAALAAGEVEPYFARHRLDFERAVIARLQVADEELARGLFAPTYRGWGRLPPAGAALLHRRCYPPPGWLRRRGAARRPARRRPGSGVRRQPRGDGRPPCRPARDGGSWKLEARYPPVLDAATRQAIEARLFSEWLADQHEQASLRFPILEAPEGRYLRTTNRSGPTERRAPAPGPGPLATLECSTSRFPSRLQVPGTARAPSAARGRLARPTARRGRRAALPPRTAPTNRRVLPARGRYPGQGRLANRRWRASWSAPSGRRKG